MPSSPAAAASPRASTLRSTAASARATRPRRSPKTAPAWRRRSASRRSAWPCPIRSIRPTRVAISEHWAADARPRCDGIVTATPGLALGVTGADCGMILFADAEARVVGAAHAGWKGALAGVVEATVAAMERLGARPRRIAAALGPCIAQASYEVGPEFVAAFAEAGEDDATASSCQACKPGHSMFDLHGYIAERAARAGVGGSRTRPRHLRRRGAFLQLPAHDPPQGARLRPAGVGDRARLKERVARIAILDFHPPSAAIGRSTAS